MRRESKLESDGEQNTASERPTRKKRKQKAVRELPERSARPVTYKDGSSEDDDSEIDADDDVSVGEPPCAYSIDIQKSFSLSWLENCSSNNGGGCPFRK